jgi:hypothetical protein
VPSELLEAGSGSWLFILQLRFAKLAEIMVYFIYLSVKYELQTASGYLR